MMSNFRYLLLVGIILVVNCSSNVQSGQGGLISQILRRDEVNKCAANTTPATAAVTDHQLNPIQRTCLPHQIQNPYPNKNPNSNDENVTVKPAIIESNPSVNIGRSLLEELLRSGDVKRQLASSGIEQRKSTEKTPDQRYNELITAFNVIAEEISHQKKESRVPIDIPSILNQMAPQTTTIARKRPLCPIHCKKSEPKSFPRDKVLNQSQMKLYRSMEKLDSQLGKLIDELRQSDDCESNDNDDYLTYDDDDLEPIILTPNDYDYVSDEPNLNVSGGNDIRRSKRSVRNSSESKDNAKGKMDGPFLAHEMVTEL